METSLKTVLETYIREVTTLVHLTVNGDELLNSNCNVLLIENHSVELTDEPTTVYNFQKVS